MDINDKLKELHSAAEDLLVAGIGERMAILLTIEEFVSALLPVISLEDDNKLKDDQINELMKQISELRSEIEALRSEKKDIAPNIPETLTI